MGWAALTYALATLALAYPALAGQFLVNPHSDQYIAGFAFRDFAAQALRAGQGIPHWNPFMFGGMPYVAAMHGDIFYPTALLRMLIGTDAGMTWGFVIHLFLSGLFTYGFLRAWGLGFFASLIGGLAYMLSGPIASYASPGHDGKLFVSALLPLALWLLVRGVRDGRHWAWGALALVVGLAVLSPHPQLLQYLLLTSGTFALYLALGSDASGAPLDRRTGMRRLAFALGAVVLGLAIGAIQFAPVREYVAWSPRAAGKDYAFATSYSFPLVEIINMYVPQFTGILDKYWGPNGIHFHSEYIGGSVLLLASAAFGGMARRSFRRFWLGTAIIALLWALGSATPFFRLVYAVVPGTTFFRAPSTIIYVFAFAVSVLAALGAERVAAAQVSRKLVLGWAGFGLLIALLATGGLLTRSAESSASRIGNTLATQQGADAGLTAQYETEWARRATSNNGALIVGAWRSFLFLALVAGLILGAARGAIPVRTLGVGLALVIALDLWSIARQYWLFSPPAKELYASDPVIEYLKAQPEPGRVVVKALGPGVAQPDPYFGRDGEGKGTGLMVHGIRSITGYHGNELGRYEQYERMASANGTPITLSPGFWRHENVRYLYTNVAIADTLMRQLVGPVKNSAGSIVYLYRVSGDNPYAQVTAGMTKAPDGDAQGAVVDPRFDPRRLAVFDTSAAIAAPTPTSLPAPLAVTASTSKLSPGHATVTLSEPAPAGSALVVSENYFPGWRATVDGKAQPVYRANYNLIGLPLPAGARTVELDFHDAAVDSGRIVTLIASLLALAALVGGAVADRRRVA